MKFHRPAIVNSTAFLFFPPPFHRKRWHNRVAYMVCIAARPLGENPLAYVLVVSELPFAQRVLVAVLVCSLLLLMNPWYNGQDNRL